MTKPTKKSINPTSFKLGQPVKVQRDFGYEYFIVSRIQIVSDKVLIDGHLSDSVEELTADEILEFCPYFVQGFTSSPLISLRNQLSDADFCDAEMFVPKRRVEVYQTEIKGSWSNLDVLSAEEFADRMSESLKEFNENEI